MTQLATQNGVRERRESIKHCEERVSGTEGRERKERGEKAHIRH